VLAIRLPPEIEERLERLAKLTGRTKTYYAREAILRHLEDLEDTFLAVERLQQPAKRWTQEELEQGLDVDG
jgi:RHH-type rel operon transcriptional repressor/antitoxin RelB